MTGKKVKTLRDKLKLTQEQLARKLNCSFTTVSRWENGHTKPLGIFLDALEKLSKVKT